MDIQSVSEYSVVALITVAVSWGVIRSEVSAMKDTMRELRENHEVTKEKVVTKEHCREVHGRTDRDFAELKADIKDIKNMLTDWVLAHGGKAK